MMIFNLPESHDHISKAKEIFKEITKDDVCVQETICVGKPNKNGIRALKLTLTNPMETENVLTPKKGLLKGRGFYISADLTQCKHEAELKKEANTRKLNGENVVFTFFLEYLVTVLEQKLNELDSFSCCDSTDHEYSVSYECSRFKLKTPFFYYFWPFSTFLLFNLETFLNYIECFL